MIFRLLLFFWRCPLRVKAIGFPTQVEKEPRVTLQSFFFCIMLWIVVSVKAREGSGANYDIQQEYIMTKKKKTTQDIRCTQSQTLSLHVSISRWTLTLKYTLYSYFSTDWTCIFQRVGRRGGREEKPTGLYSAIVWELGLILVPHITALGVYDEQKHTVCLKIMRWENCQCTHHTWMIKLL